MTTHDKPLTPRVQVSGSPDVKLRMAQLSAAAQLSEGFLLCLHKLSQDLFSSCRSLCALQVSFDRFD